MCVELHEVLWCGCSTITIKVCPEHLDRVREGDKKSCPQFRIRVAEGRRGCKNFTRCPRKEVKLWAFQLEGGEKIIERTNKVRMELAAAKAEAEAKGQDTSYFEEPFTDKNGNKNAIAVEKWNDGPTFEEDQGREKRARYMDTIGRSNKDGSQQEMKEDQLFDVRAYNTRNDPIPLPSPLEQSPVRVQNEGFSGYEAFTVRQSDDMEMTDWNAN